MGSAWQPRSYFPAWAARTRRWAAFDGDSRDWGSEAEKEAHACDLTLFLPPGLAAAGTGLGGNCTGCVICSEENGCSTCQQRLFLFIRREGIRQYGKCVHDCPLGFFGIRGQEANRCKKCGATCDSCFSQDFCIRCKRRFHLYKGKCLPTCPPGTLTHQSTHECQEECEPSPWGSWSPCIRNGKTCGSGWGLETRVREAGPAKQEETASCRVLSESRKCPIKRPCPGERNPRQKSRKDRRQRKDRKSERRPQQPGSQ
ncbi:R-spondin-4 [Peromyscus leucopus]|uniref:R-spondin-4 n=1 Tax=Peromyscus leucopus TaxID=10041 RepID=UPI00188523F0|nr:R-spondin-4 [Peromyscus leucopus]